MRSRALGRALLVYAIACWAIVVDISATPQARPTDLSVSDRVVIASKIYSLVQQYFAHWESAPRSEVEAAYREYVDHTVRSADRKDFDLATMRFVARLRNGHTQFFDNQLDGRPLKFRLLQMENDWVVVDSQESRLPRGALVRTVNGSLVEDFVRERAQYVAASSERLARTHVFSYPGLFPERVSVGLRNGTVVVVDRAIRGNVPDAPAVSRSEGRWLLQNRLAYIRIPAFADPAYERSAIELVGRFASSPNLVVDVRGNGGGTSPTELTRALMNRAWRTWQETTPQHIALLEARGIPPMQASRDTREESPSSSAYAGRLFVLIDRYCGSACEDFVMPFKDNGRAVLIGETTQGSSGNPYRASLGNGMSIAIGAVRYRFPDGTPFEGVGIAPDIPIVRTAVDIASNHDVVLQRAQELAARDKSAR